MLRRRKKSPKPRSPIALPPGASAPPATRRRARPGVQVPSTLIVEEPALATASRPAAEPRPAKARDAGVVLVTGFDAFCGEKTNPSWEICTRLPKSLAGLRVETARVPCEFRRAIEVVAAAIERHRPELVVCLGQAGGRAHLGVERVAINVDDARVEDNAGARPIDEPIAPLGPPAYFATLPIKAMVEGMRAVGVPAEVSNSAGTYVCNHLMYGVLHFLAGSGRKARAGFIHVPYAEEQVLDKPAIAAMSISTMVKGVEAAIVAASRHATDLKVGGGTLD
jgi:pyroglutamyl-peptidase